MLSSKSLKFLQFINQPIWFLHIYLFFYCQISWAVQEGIIIADKAVIYSDMDTSSPIGVISKGKKILIGDHAQNNSQVYAVIVSGKIAFIKVKDISTERETIKSSRLTAERFQRSTNTQSLSNISVSYFQFNSQIRLDNENGDVVDKNVFNWYGLSLKGESNIAEKMDLQVIINYMFSTSKGQAYRASEFGFGVSRRFFESKRFSAKIEFAALSIPFVTYSVGDDFRSRSYGYSLGSGLNLHYLLNNEWAIHLSGGLYHTGLFTFDNPSPYLDSSPSFNGLRYAFGVQHLY